MALSFLPGIFIHNHHLLNQIAIEDLCILQNPTELPNFRFGRRFLPELIRRGFIFLCEVLIDNPQKDDFQKLILVFKFLLTTPEKFAKVKKK